MDRKLTDLERSPATQNPPDDWAPLVEAVETEEFFLFMVLLPGAFLQSVQIDMDKGVVTLAGNRFDFQGGSGTDQMEAITYVSHHHAKRQFDLIAFEQRFALPNGYDLKAAVASYSSGGGLEIRLPKTGKSPTREPGLDAEAKLLQRSLGRFPPEDPVEFNPFPIDFVSEQSLDSNDRETHRGLGTGLFHEVRAGIPAYGRQPYARVESVVEDDRIIQKGDVRYFPLVLAAQLAQAPRTTLIGWIKNKTKFQGRMLDRYHSATAGKLYISEESVNRVANRFVKWPSSDPAGRVILGKTTDQSGFIALPEGGRILGVAKRTMWLWATQGKAPGGHPLNVIKCQASDHFYIQERDIAALKALIPTAGLRRGRPPQQLLPQ